MLKKVKESVSSGYLKGAVDGGQSSRRLARVQEMLDQLNPGRGLGEGDSTDWYGDDVLNARGDVSLERAALRELRLKDALDDQVEDENKFPEDPDLVTRHGLLPCKRANGSSY